MRRVILLLAVMAATLVVVSGVAWALNKIGTNGSDTLKGTNKADNLLGKGGNDALFGLGGSDKLLGGEGKDWLLGGRRAQSLGGDKNLLGGSGNDGIVGEQGSDDALGEEGNDYMVDGDIRESSHDNFSGGAGNDVLWVSHVPAFKDVVVCGEGFDLVGADPKDEVAPECERVVIIRNAAQDEEFFESIPQSFLEGLAPFPEFPE
jgi:RTX calcium-binding nonapeptide repeat (4 copies)